MHTAWRYWRATTKPIEGWLDLHRLPDSRSVPKQVLSLPLRGLVFYTSLSLPPIVLFTLCDVCIRLLELLHLGLLLLLLLPVLLLHLEALSLHPLLLSGFLLPLLPHFLVLPSLLLLHLLLEDTLQLLLLVLLSLLVEVVEGAQTKTCRWRWPPIL